MNGAPGAIRTPDLLVRSRNLRPFPRFPLVAPSSPYPHGYWGFMRFWSSSSCPYFTLFSQGGTPQNAPYFLARSTRVPFPARMGSVASFEEPCQSGSIQQTSPASRPLAPENLLKWCNSPRLGSRHSPMHFFGGRWIFAATQPFG